MTSGEETCGKKRPAVLSPEEIIGRLREHYSEMKTRFSLRRIGIFGSHARGGADEGSDMDLLIELDEPTFDNYMNLKFFLEELFKRPVDLVMADNVKPRLKSVIAREAIYA